MTRDGILNLNKPPGITSFAAVAQVKRLCQQKRVGHAGSLDPMATGVLPICLGQATRLVEYLQETPKTYVAEIELGKTTDTYDASGTVTSTGDYSHATLQSLHEALASLQGTIQQTPPPYSAVKLGGKRLYELARSGVDVKPVPREVRVYRISLLDWQPPRLRLEIECGKGTYIRSLAHDLGRLLGCGAYLYSLVRTRYGPFHLAEAVTLEQVEKAFRQGQIECPVHPPELAVAHLPAAAVDGEQEQSLRHGRSIALAGYPPGEHLRACSQSGILLAVLVFDPVTGLWHPHKVFA